MPDTTSEAATRAWCSIAAVSEHRGVGVIVTNGARTRFVVQRKDATYPRYPRGCSLFGGAREPGETDEQALVRELFEALGDASAAAIVAAGLRHVADFELGPRRFGFAMFEAVLDDARLDLLAARPVYEGERAEIAERSGLAALPWVWTLGDAIAAYLRTIEH